MHLPFNQKPDIEKDSRLTLLPGQVFGQYRIIAQLGKGGMGEVFKATHTTLNKIYAIKVMSASFTQEKNILHRFQREAHIMAQLDHPNIIKVDEFGETSGRYWFRMKLCEGIGDNIVTLQDFVASKGGRLEEEQLASLLKDILSALSYAHEHGAIHRDVKPTNILLEKSQSTNIANIGFRYGNIVAKVTDFGLARIVPREARSQAAQTFFSQCDLSDGLNYIQKPDDTSVNMIVGTYSYMSPEQMCGEDADERSDIYSIGLMIYRLLTGHQQSIGNLPSIERSGCLTLWDNLIRKSIQRDPKQRHQSADEMLDDVINIEKELEARNFCRAAKEAADNGYPDIVIVEAMDVRPHPSANLLTLVTVSDGIHDYQVVSGAPNLIVGKRYVMARVGCTLPNGRKLRPARIRGIKCEGMLCSKDDLLLSDKPEKNLFEVGSQWVSGTPFAIVLQNSKEDQSECSNVARDNDERGITTLRYFNSYHLRKTKTGYLPCLTPNCGSFLSIDLSDARALLEYKLRDNPAAVFHADCSSCKKKSTYDYSTLLKLTPVELHPVPLSERSGWAIILMEIPTTDEMPHRAFWGERVLIQNLCEDNFFWQGQISSESQLAPSLQRGTSIEGQKFNAHRVCTGVIRDNQKELLPLDPPSSNLDIASFFVPKHGLTSMLQCANVSCANPSCAHYFGLTYDQFQKTARDIAESERKYESWTSGYLILKCEICQVSRVIDSRSFDGLFKP